MGIDSSVFGVGVFGDAVFGVTSTYYRALSESSVKTDSLSRTVSFSRSLSEGNSLTDDDSKNIRLLLSEGLTGFDSVSKGLVREFFEGVLLSDVVAEYFSLEGSDRTGRKPLIIFSGISEVTGKGGNIGYGFDVSFGSNISFSTNLSVDVYSYWYKDTDTWVWVYKDSTGLYVDNVLDNGYGDIVSFVGGVVTLKSGTADSVVSDFRVFHRDLTVAQKQRVYNDGEGTLSSAVVPELLFKERL